MRKVFSIFALMLLAASLLLPAAPVTARPLYDTYTSQPDGAAGMDAVMIGQIPDTNFGTENLYAEQSSGQPTIDSLLKFDLSIIPENAIINSATLTLTVQIENSLLVDDIISIHRVKQNWTEDGATWNTYDGSNLWQTPGGLGESDLDTTALSTLAFTGISADTPENFALDTVEVKKMIDGTNPNYGFLVKSTGVDYKAWSFYSSDADEEESHPKLVIDYSLPTEETPTPSGHPTPAIVNSMTYGDIANTAVNMLILSVLTLAFIFFVVTTIIMRKRG